MRSFGAVTIVMAILAAGCTGQNPLAPSAMPGASASSSGGGSASILAAGSAADGLVAGTSARGGNASLSQQLAAVRQATARFHDVRQAEAAGYEMVTECLSSPAGAMGFHYGKLSLFDGTVNALEPEALVYEPRGDGTLHLVAVEYIAPQGASPNPPALFGQTFHQGPPGLWVLHAWIWKPNPSGVFEDWNPNASCPAS